MRLCLLQKKKMLDSRDGKCKFSTVEGLTRHHEDFSRLKEHFQLIEYLGKSLATQYFLGSGAQKRSQLRHRKEIPFEVKRCVPIDAKILSTLHRDHVTTTNIWIKRQMRK